MTATLASAGPTQASHKAAHTSQESPGALGEEQEHKVVFLAPVSKDASVAVI